MRLFKKIAAYLKFILILPLVYIVISLVCTYITVNNTETSTKKTNTIYLSSNGVHLEIIIPKKDLNPSILENITYKTQVEYFSFGWGDKNFYVETPVWADLTFANGFKALFINSSTLLHVTRYTATQNDWIEVKVNQQQLHKINQYIFDSFHLDSNNKKIILPGLGYYTNDDFYEAKGSYTCFKTCNSWVNTGLKKSNIKACLWTPYDFGVIRIHSQEQ